MAKFDHRSNLPKIFKDNNLSILPISRSKYLISFFETYQTVQYDKDAIEKVVSFPENIETIDCTNLYSESAVLNCAFHAGIIDEIAEDTVHHTISGRMSTGSFKFQIDSSVGSYTISPIEVENSQCEIDGGFEGKDCLVLFEVKKYSVDDFLIRQLYYPYRLWREKTRKVIKPVLLTYSNDVFSFFVYRFKDPFCYNSLELVKQVNYSFNQEEITRDDVNNVFNHLCFVENTESIPFPQANKFERVVDLLTLLQDKDLSLNEIAESYQFDIRQSGYYTNACRYLGLVEKSSDAGVAKTRIDTMFCLSEEGKKLLNKRHREKVLLLIEKILQHKVFYEAFSYSRNGKFPSTSEIVSLMEANSLPINGNTLERRASTVQRWIEWIWEQCD